jgi:hypothetical protein
MAGSMQPQRNMAAKAPVSDGMIAMPEGELYSYHAPEKATIGTDRMNRVPMMASVTVPIKRDYSIQLPGIDPWSNAGPDQRTSAALAVRFKNDVASKLGIPLPAGAVRVYSPESESGSYIGASSLNDTPKDASIYLTLSKVFDVYSQSKAVGFKRLTKKTVRKSYEVVVHNEKKSAVTVRLVQNVYPIPIAINESSKSIKLDASQRQWTVDVPAGGETKLTYSVDMRG